MVNKKYTHRVTTNIFSIAMSRVYEDEIFMDALGIHCFADLLGHDDYDLFRTYDSDLGCTARAYDIIQKLAGPHYKTIMKMMLIKCK